MQKLRSKIRERCDGKMEKIILRACKLNFKISLILLRDKLHEIKYKYDVKRARDSNPSVNSSILAFPYVY